MGAGGGERWGLQWVRGQRHGDGREARSRRGARCGVYTVWMHKAAHLELMCGWEAMLPQ